MILEPDQTATLDIIYGIGETREQALDLVEKYQDERLANRVFDLAWTHSQVVLRQLNAPRPTPSSTDGWPARSSMPMRRCVPNPACSQEPARSVRTLESCDLG
jgi:hypothetical protein